MSVFSSLAWFDDPVGTFVDFAYSCIDSEARITVADESAYLKPEEIEVIRDAMTYWLETKVKRERP